MPQCNVPNCARDIGLKGAKGMCPLHYGRWRRTGHIDIQPKRWMNQQECSVDVCKEPARKLDMCANHYSRVYKYGRTEVQTVRWRKDGEPCLWCRAAVPASRGRSNYCTPSCELLRSQNRARGVEKRPTGYTCERCGDAVKLSVRSEGSRLRRADGKMCDQCRRARRHTRHHMSLHRLVRRDGSNCGICGERVDIELKFPHPLSPTVDHIIPWAKGGTHDPDNLQLAHYTCNCRKQATLPAGVTPAA